MDLLDRIRATGLLPPGEPVVVLLSGGRDSTCLLDAAARLAGTASTTALHVDHGLRGPQASAREREHCADLADRLGVALEVHAAPPRDPEADGNVHAWAREVRHAAGHAAAAARGARLALGHTATDQVETVLYRLATSPGRRALLGMAAQREDGLVRPLLAARVTREETAAHCAGRDLPVLEDPSNDDPGFARARVRHGLVPALAAVDARASDNILRTAELLREEAAVLDELIATTLAGRDRIPRQELRVLPPALARLVVRHLAEQATGALCPRASHRLDELLALESGALDVGDGARLVVRRGEVHAERTPPLRRSTA
ncbi:tRNA lysidine(34) synthetase TilS [Conexibacter sp. SYSU D00693]|uniref:tRNA lysidine(34) synthetase TilS n=1 Tax=Conexibacter sp. SYSU D00693 TaxID=2812560 RepID=UPI00196A7602|nr:tRNA lysidine(34) synthetase TilS [Conexibacter sp. SYSU D00693]